MLIEIISHIRVTGSSSSGKQNEQFKVADLQWCNVLSTNLIRSEIFVVENQFQRLHSRDSILKIL